MFSRFAAALYSAVDALAPPLPLQEDFIWHWKSVTKFYTSKNVTNNMPIKETSIPEHIHEMLSILEQEDKEMDPGSIGPCMEYVMDHKLLDTMCVLATADSPLGMKRYMLMFVTRLLKMLRQFLIPHVSIYVPVNKFIKICGEVVAAPSENEELAFLEAVCDKLTENPHLVNCFMGPAEVVSSRRNSNNDCTLTHNSATQSQAIVSNCSECALVSSLLTLFNSPDNRISVGAGECLKTCCSLANDAAAIAIIQNTDLSQVLCSHVLMFYNTIPKNTKLSDIEQPVVSSLAEDLSANHKTSSNRRKFLCYLQHLHYFDCIVQQAHPVVSDNLTITFRKEFLDSEIYNDLVTSPNKDHNLFVTAVVSSSLRYLASSKLISTFSLFLLGDVENFEISGHSSHVIKDLIISRCRDTKANLPLSMATLQLFEELLQRPSQFTLHNLVISYVDSRGYYDHMAADDWFSFSDNDSGPMGRDDEDTLSSSPPANATFAPPYIHRILDAYLSLLPDDIKSVEVEEDSDYDTYIKEARVRFMKLLLHCEDFDWPQEPLTREDCHLGLEDDSSSDSQPEADSHCWHFNEGPFLSMIFDKIECMLDMPYDINLQVTSIVARLALFTHPNLHEYLLNPLIPLAPGVRTLFSVLSKVVSDIEKRVQDLKSFRQKLRITRKALLSDDDDDYETIPESNTLEVLIIIEEFCKELAAIAFVKYNAAC